jgi:hypothetical protein
MKLVASHTPIIIDRMRNKDTQTDERWVDHGGGLPRALSPTFRAGAMVFFIPWRVVAEESGAAHYGFGGAMLLDLLGPRSGCWPHDGEVAGGAVGDSTLVIFRFGATMELGRSERPTMRPLWSYGVDGADTPDRKPR